MKIYLLCKMLLLCLLWFLAGGLRENPKDIPFENFVGATVVLNHGLANQIGIVFPPEIAALDGKDAPRAGPRF